MSDGWIVIPNWNKLQHYGDRRDPPWFKTYISILHDDAYLGLTGHQRGTLHGLWAMYAASHRQVRDSTTSVSRQLNMRVTRATLDALNHAGLIEFSASKPLAAGYQPASTHALARSKKEIKKKTEPVDNTKEQRHEELCARAEYLAGKWNGASSDAFAAELDNLERELHSRLTHMEREQLLDQALTKT